MQQKLNVLTIDDPFRIRNSDEVITFLKGWDHDKKLQVFSVDVKDLYYTIPQAEILSAVNKHIEKHGVIAFQNECGISADAFLELLSFYLCSTFVEWNGDMYIQKDGICIGSCLAPVLSDMFLALRDKTLQDRLEGFCVCRIFRFVDDYFVLVQNDNLSFEQQFLNIHSVFTECLKPLVLTHETPLNDSIRFLDLALHFTPSHVCWSYEPRAKKPILPYASAHSKLVKRAIIHSVFNNVLKKCCQHSMELSFAKQVDRLTMAGYPSDVLVSVAEKQLKNLRPRHTSEPVRQRERRKVVVLPYLHQVSHNLRKIGSRAGVDVVFSAPEKLSSLCKKVNCTTNETRRCKVKHGDHFVPCKEGVVYSLPMSCGKKYIGQTGRCLNKRLKEHSDNVARVATSGHVAKHCRDCSAEDDSEDKCEPMYRQCSVIGKHRDTLTREIIEAAMIIRLQDECISAPSVALSQKEMKYLECEI